MIVYSNSKARFLRDVASENIESVVFSAVNEKLGLRVSKSELRSWRNSLTHMSNVLSAQEIPDNAGIAIEYNIPLTSKRIDFIITGTNDAHEQTAVIIELKQWAEVDVSDLDAIVKTRLGGGIRETSHPSYQAWSYAAHIEDYNETVRNESIRLVPCAHLHNLTKSDAVNDVRYAEHTQKAPVFIAGDFAKLQKFLAQHIRYGDDTDLMYRIEHGRIKPSKSLADMLTSMMQGNEEFRLLDEQKLIYEHAINTAVQAHQNNKKQVIIVKGGPGTGKSVIAINLLIKATGRELVAQYVSRNSAPREVFQAKLASTITKTRINNLFKGSGTFTESPSNFFDLLIVDEAHRLNEKSGMFSNKGENQVKEIINAAKCSIFFIDESQRVHIKDIGSRAEIKQWALFHGAQVSEFELKSQFRCNGSDAYLAWLDNTLQIRETANFKLTKDEFNLQVVDSPEELENKIRERNRINNKARMVAGYCWDWKSKKDPLAYDISFDGHDFAARWNLASQGMHWIIHEDSVNEVGCIHTCQGLELDYVGVIIGPDMIVRKGKVITDGLERSKHDQTLKGYKNMLKSKPALAKALAGEIIKNTYRTLLTRGQKACYVYSADSETRDYLKSRLQSHKSTSPISYELKREIVNLARHDRSMVAECAKKYQLEEADIRTWVAKVEAAEKYALEE